MENESLSSEKQEDYDILITYVKRETAIADNDTIQYDVLLNLKSYTVTNKETFSLYNLMLKQFEKCPVKALHNCTPHVKVKNENLNLELHSGKEKT